MKTILSSPNQTLGLKSGFPTVLKSLFTLLLLFCSIGVWGQTPVPMSSQPGLSYTENFADITNWTNNFTAGTGANRWKSYPVTGTGNAIDGIRTTKSSATFVGMTTGGVQKGTGNLVFLSTGSTATTEAVAVDFLLDFTGVNAGTLSFNWAALDNSSGTRPTSLRVYWSTDNVTFTEITAAQVIDVQSADSGSKTLISLPAAFNNSAVARLRFYNHAGTVNGSGNRDKISIDDVTVTAAAVSACIKPTTPNGTFTGSQTGCSSTNIVYTHGISQPESGINYYWQTSNTGTVASAANLVSSGSNYNVTTSGSYFVRAYNSSTDCWSDATAGYAVTITTAPPSITANPSNASVIAGNSASFSVTETGGTAYQWQEDTGGGFANISGATLSTYNTGTTTLAMDGYKYRVIVTNICGSVISNFATLTVTAGLANDNCNGAQALTVNAGATSGTLVGSTFQSPFDKNDVWYSFTPTCSVQHTITLNGFSGDYAFSVYSACPPSPSTLIVTKDTTSSTEADTRVYTQGITYYIRVWKFSGSDGPFNIQLISPSLNTPTTITASPTTFCAGAMVTFTAATVTNANSYVWTVPADWTMTPSSANVMTAIVGSAGAVTAQAVNCYGTGIAKSNTFTPNTIPATPGTISGSATVCEGSSNTFSISAVTGATSYTWTLPSGWTGTSTTTSINAVAGLTGGNITVVAKNTCGTSVAQTLAVAVSAPPATPAVPTSNNASCGNVTLTRGTPPANIVWYWQGNNANGTLETNSNLTYLANSTGTYYLRAKNTATGCWSTISSSSAVTINEITSITAQPVNQTVSVESQAAFTVSTTGSGLSYQWQVDIGGGFANVTEGSGASTDSYTTANATLAMNGYKYRVVITGPCGNVTSDGNATLTVSEIVYVNGDYKSTSTGLWNPAVTQTAAYATWERYNGTSWSSSAVPATSTSNNVYIADGHTVSTGTSIASSLNLKVLGGGTFVCQHNSTANSVYIYSGGVFQMVTNPLRINSTFEIEDDGTFILNTNGTGSALTLWYGTEIFHPKSNFKVINTNTGSGNYFLPAAGSTTGSSLISSNTYNGITAYFGNLIFDGVGDSRLTATNLSSTTTYLTHGNLEFRPTTNYSILYGSGTWTVGKDLIMNAGTSGNLTVNSGANTIALNVKGNFINKSTNIFRLVNANATPPNVTLNVDRNIELISGSLDLNFANGASGAVNLKGDLSVGSTAQLLANNFTTATFNFNGIGDGTTDALTQTIDVLNPTTASNITFNVNDGAYVKLINQDLALGTNSKFNVLSGGTLDFGFNGSTPLNVAISGSTLLQSFAAQSGSTLKITSPQGLTTSATPTVGNVQLPTRTFDAGATYHYIGKSASTQVTGNAIATAALPLTGTIIVDMETAAGKFNASDSRTINTPGTLEIRTGVVTDDSTNGFIGTGNVTMNFADGRYITSRTGTQPELKGDYLLTDGVVEFANSQTTPASIRVTPEYFNVDISGNNVQPGGKNFVVNNLLKVTSTGKLTVPSAEDNENPYVVTASKGIQVAEGRQAIFKNNANLMQDKDAVNSGNITLERKATVPSVQYNYWSSPVKDQPLYSLYPGIPDNKVMVYNSANDRFTVLPTSSNPKSVFAKGYSIKGSSDTDYAPALTATFVGEPHNESTAGINSILLSTAGSNYNLIGNPYPSNLDLMALYTDNSSKFYNEADETPTAYFWDNVSNTETTQQGSTYNQSNYALLNLSSGMGTPAPCGSATCGTSSGKKPNGIVKPGQGFIMRAAEAGGDLSFKNNYRTTSVGTNGTYFKGGAATNDKFWLKLTTPKNMNIVIAIAYNPNAENAFERFDSKVMSEAVTENFYSLSSDAKKLAIQGRQGDFADTDMVPLGIKTFSTGNQKISIDEKGGVFETQNIYLKDKLLNTVVNLSENAYEFNAAAGSYDNRFEIVYKPETVLGAEDATGSRVEVYREGDDFVVRSSGKNIDQVEVFDASGRLQQKVTGKTAKMKVPGSSLQQGMYVLKITMEDTVLSRKVMK